MLPAPFQHRVIARSVAIALALALSQAAATFAAPHDATTARYLVFRMQDDGAVRPVLSTRVRLDAPLSGRSLATAPVRTRDADEVVVRLRDAGLADVFVDRVRIPRWRRGEFHGAQTATPGQFDIEGHLLPEENPSFVVRVPDLPGTTLELEAPGAATAATFDLDALDADRAVLREAPVARTQALPGWSNGAPANRLDLLIVGEGYTAAQQAKFSEDAAALVDEFFSITPYSDYRNYVNVTTLFVASLESGVDQPRYDPSCNDGSFAPSCCADPDADGTTARSVATAFSGTMCTLGIQRLLTVDDARVFTAAAAQPNWDVIFVVANTSTYGGSGGAIAVASTNEFATQVAQHEVGHSFMHLADEYTAPYPGYPDCSDVAPDALRCEANVTDRTTRAQIKWARWIAPSQPIPSSAAPSIDTAAGLWPGARYKTSGMYRQGFACIMRNLGAPFCKVAAETYPLRLYGGGWGVPAGGIDNVEPGTERPPPGNVQAAFPGGTYQATILGPSSGPAVAVQWYLDGAPVATQSVASGGVASYTLSTTSGAHVLELRATDQTALVHPTLRDGIVTTRTWNIVVAPPTASPGVLENPPPGSFQSGIGLISGWVCAAQHVTYRVDAGPEEDVAYGTSRADTSGVCGDGNNGFGSLINWGVFGDGTHTLRAFADGIEIGSAVFTVTTFGTPFLRGASGQYTIDGFPTAETSVVLRWQEAAQNFVIAGAGALNDADLASPQSSAVGVLENPSPGAFQSGIGVISGWVCAAGQVTIGIDDQAPFPAAYGTGRADTIGVCGDADNGFGSLINWSLLGDGTHTLVAYADGVSFGQATFTVTTLGTAFLTGASGQFVLPEFAGSDVTVRWQQAQQNFVIVGR
jgi:hypothetical protein